MATIPLVPVETYLSTVYEPDCEYVDGLIEERPMPEYDHAVWQAAILAFFREHRLEWNTRALPELRVRVATTRYRVPDVTVLDRDAPVEQVVATAPLAVFEILSPENRMTAMLVKLADYEQMGVGGIFLIEPEEGVARCFKHGKLELANVLELPTLGIAFTLEDIREFID